MVAPTLLPGWLAAGLWTGASVAALAAVVVLVRHQLDRPAPGWLVALVTAGALALEPVWQNLTFGQVNLILMLAVLLDLVRPERRWSGVLVGIAAGVKLTPLVFVVLLVLVGRRAAAGRAALAFAGTVAIGFVAAPDAAAAYWSDDLVDAGRVGSPDAGAQPVGVRRAHPAAWTDRRRPCCGWRSPDRWRSRSLRRRCRPGGVAATGCSAPASARWPC